VNDEFMQRVWNLKHILRDALWRAPSIVCWLRKRSVHARPARATRWLEAARR